MPLSVSVKVLEKVPALVLTSIFQPARFPLIGIRHIFALSVVFVVDNTVVYWLLLRKCIVMVLEPPVEAGVMDGPSKLKSKSPAMVVGAVSVSDCIVISDS